MLIIIMIIIIIIIILNANNNNDNNNNNNNNARGDSSVDRLLCVFLVERFAVRISPLAFLRTHLICAVRKKRSGKIILGVP